MITWILRPDGDKLFVFRTTISSVSLLKHSKSFFLKDIFIKFLHKYKVQV